ncbi:SMI1/KNR4 family protein [Verrucosispora sp. SN26_14.1]|uniref:SMI1/KNR4 family protein n=1 Tax=Verrucosispora sp. SN26_14.1 TaxID=2527879 RepID=UPI001375EE66|nr:SMI1/KNR4 family protein [Verrucosispora sp. SN26_14.1]
MNLEEFDALVEPLRQKSAASIAAYGFTLIEGRTATTAEIDDLEKRLGVTLPEKYRSFMMRYGGGMVGCVELFPIAGGDSGDDVKSVNDREFPERTFIAIAPVGSGDYWGFPVDDGNCRDEVWFHFHDGGDPELEAPDVLGFVARRGLRL